MHCRMALIKHVLPRFASPAPYKTNTKTKIFKNPKKKKLFKQNIHRQIFNDPGIGAMASAFHQKQQVLGSSLRINLSKTKQKIKNKTAYQSPLLDPAKVKTSRPDFDIDNYS